MAKEYKIYESKKARGDQGNCAVCNCTIENGSPYKYAEPSLGQKVFFCTGCEVDQNLIGKNAQSGKVREVLEAKTSGPTKAMANLITKEQPSFPKPALVEEDEDGLDEENEILAKSCLEIPKAYCKKCKRNHEVGSRRYEKHIRFMTKI